MSQHSEVKVGAVVIFALVVLAIVAYYVWGPGKVGETWSIRIVFSDAQGLTGGEPVRMSGVEIGEVKEVTLNPNHEAMVTLHIKNSVPIYKNYTFTISTGALVPERYVEVHPSPVDFDTPQFRPGAVTQGLSTPGIQDIIVSLHQMLAKLQNTADSLNLIIGDPEVITSTKEMVQQLEIASRQAAQMMLTLEALSRESSPDISRAVDQIAQASADASRAITYLSKRIETSPAPDDLEAAIKVANESLQNARDITAELKGLLGDKELQGDFRTSMANVREISNQLVDASKNIKDITSDVKAGSPHFKSIAENADKFLGGANKFKGKFQLPRTNTRFDFLEAPKLDRSVTDANFDIWFGGGRSSLRLGIADIGEQNEVNLQRGRRRGNQAFRYGLVRSKLGVGGDLYLGGRSQLSVDVFDPNEVRADVTGAISLTDSTGLIIGVRDVWGDNLGFVGARFGR